MITQNPIIIVITLRKTNQITLKWVVNYQPLTEVQDSHLAHGPNFTVALKHLLLYLDYSTATETMRHSPYYKEPGEFRSEINMILKGSHPLKPNLSKTE